VIKNILNRGKDLAISIAIKKVVNLKIKQFGEVLKSDFDSTTKTIDIEVWLKGEKDILKVFVDKYSIKEENNKHYLIVNNITSSREWLTSVLEKYVTNKKFQIPNEYVKIVKVVI
jgi:hypothetical protein